MNQETFPCFIFFGQMRISKNLFKHMYIYNVKLNKFSMVNFNLIFSCYHILE